MQGFKYQSDLNQTAQKQGSQENLLENHEFSKKINEISLEETHFPDVPREKPSSGITKKNNLDGKVGANRMNLRSFKTARNSAKFTEQFFYKIDQK